MKTNLFIEGSSWSIEYHDPIMVIGGDKICADVYGNNEDEPISFDKQVGMFFVHPIKGYIGFTVDRVRKTSFDDENYAVRNRGAYTNRLKEPLSKIDRVNYSGKMTPDKINLIKATSRAKKFVLKIDSLTNSMNVIEEHNELPPSINALQAQDEVTVPSNRESFARLMDETLSVSFGSFGSFGSNGNGFYWPYGMEMDSDVDVDRFYETDHNGERVDYCEEYEEDDDE